MTLWAEAGHAALAMGLALSLMAAAAGHGGAAWRSLPFLGLARGLTYAQGLMALIAFAALTQAYLRSDFSVVNVLQNSHTLKPLFYKITGVWGNHEGSLLLWILCLAGCGAAVARFGRDLPATFAGRVLGTQSLIAAGFFAFVFFTSNPFWRVDPAPLDGMGLNPLLQDPGLAFHPPLLYVGYVGFSIAFSFAVAALIEGRVDPIWARWVRPWSLFAWSFLTLGIALGSYWAYYELGWGGFWFWDPVENASLMPWIAGTALLHSVRVLEKRATLKSWTVLLALLAFSLSLLGAFLVRSGVLNSVHAFANDPTRGQFILGFLALVIGGGLTLYAMRAHALKPQGAFSPLSRESFLVFNNLLLMAILAAVVFGTLYPLLLDALTGEKLTVGPPYFNGVVGLIALPLFLGLGLGPWLSWKRADLDGLIGPWMALAGASLGVTILWGWVMGIAGPLALAVLLAGVWIIAASLAEWLRPIRLGQGRVGDHWRRLRHRPRAAHAMMLAHLGMGVSMVGVVVASMAQTETLQAMRPGDQAQVGAYRVVLEAVEDYDGPNFRGQRATFLFERDGAVVARLFPETRIYPNPPMQTHEADFTRAGWGHLYATLGPADGATGERQWGARLYVKPFVLWIWLGALLMAAGGLLAMTDRRGRKPVREGGAA